MRGRDLRARKCVATTHLHRRAWLVASLFHASEGSRAKCALKPTASDPDVRAIGHVGWFALTLTPLAADDSSLVALNMIPTLPAAAVRTLREIAARSPERLLAVDQSGSFEQGPVRIGRDGVVIDGRRVAAVHPKVSRGRCSPDRSLPVHISGTAGPGTRRTASCK